MDEIKNFGWALEMLKDGLKVCRSGWNGKGMWLVLVAGQVAPVQPDSVYAKGGKSEVVINPHIDMMTATGEMQPGWLASQTDMLAEDWEIVE